MRRWFILSAIGRDRPGIVADLATLIFKSEANLEDSRMTLLGNEFAAILLCSGTAPDLESRLRLGAGRLEWENRLTIFLRPLEGEPRPAVPAPGTGLFRIEAEGLDRAGIVAGVCRTLADRRCNIADLSSSTRTSETGSTIYRLSILAEVPEPSDTRELETALDDAGRTIGVEVRIEPA